MTTESHAAPPRTVQVPVAGGELTAGIWGSGSPTVLAVHGITASHRAWALVAAQFGSGTLIAPDLRGRGGSADLPGPYGMAAHADDCVALLDALGVDDAVVAGHSMGGFVAAVLAHRHPARVRRVVLVDGGPPLPLPESLAQATPEQVLDAVIGPAARRLSMRFGSREEYHEFWRAHPAFAGIWSEFIESYVDYDLTGEPGALRSRAAVDAVRADTADIHTGDTVRAAYAGLSAEDAVFLRAERGMLDEPVPLYPDPAPIAERLAVRTVPGTNHYTILLGEPGARAVADAVTG